jgi:hypothetical protein
MFYHLAFSLRYNHWQGGVKRQRDSAMGRITWTKSW